MFQDLSQRLIFIGFGGFLTRVKFIKFGLCFLIFTTLCNCKLVTFFTKSLNKSLKYYLNFNLGFSYSMIVKSSLQSHPLWVTLWIISTGINLPKISQHIPFTDNMLQSPANLTLQLRVHSDHPTTFPRYSSFYSFIYSSIHLFFHSLIHLFILSFIIPQSLIHY